MRLERPAWRHTSRADGLLCHHRDTTDGIVRCYGSRAAERAGYQRRPPRLSRAGGRRIQLQVWGDDGTSQPYTLSYASFELIQSRSITTRERFVQTGWPRQDPCGSTTFVFWESYNPDRGTPYINKCREYFPTGDKDYYNEHDGSPGTYYWCNGYQGTVLHCEYATSTGFVTANKIVAYGEASSHPPSVHVVMGNVGRSQALWLTNIKYKVNQTGTLWNYVQSGTGAGRSYAACNYDPCPYFHSYSYAASVLWVFNYSDWSLIP